MEISDATVLAKYPAAYIDHDNKVFWKGLLQHRLLINRCEDCGHWHYPYHALCPRCWSDQVAATEVSGRGTVYSRVLFHQGPAVEGINYSKSYPGVSVELAEQPGLKIQTTIVNCRNEDIYIGMPVELTWVERQGVPVPAFQPAPGALPTPEARR
jgi:uncharacterized OB-fold protein